jgi:hypothetical protein
MARTRSRNSRAPRPSTGAAGKKRLSIFNYLFASNAFVKKEAAEYNGKKWWLSYRWLIVWYCLVETVITLLFFKDVSGLGAFNSAPNISTASLVATIAFSLLYFNWLTVKGYRSVGLILIGFTALEYIRHANIQAVAQGSLIWKYATDALGVLFYINFMRIETFRRKGYGRALGRVDNLFVGLGTFTAFFVGIFLIMTIFRPLGING